MINKNRIYCGVDNGVTGSIGIIDNGDVSIFPIPVLSEQSYTKSKQLITRVDSPALWRILREYENQSVLAIIERPMVNPGRFKATMSALRCLEAVLICIEELNFARMYCDSKEWQRELLPKNLEKNELKKASLDIAQRLFPTVEFKKIKDGDSLLIAEWARRHNL